VNKQPILVAGLLLALFAVVGTGLVAFTQEQTRDRIAQNERDALLRSLNALVPPQKIDNDSVTDITTANDPRLLGGNSIKVYRGRRGASPVAAVFATVVPDGYSGPIKLLVAVNVDGTLGGVRIVAHKETPGLGDKVEERRSDWVYSFNGKSLDNPKPEKWKVKRDGGVFDQFTGATVTPRSIVKAVKNTLIYFRENGGKIFDIPVKAETAQHDAETKAAGES
jgi:electron transport complex protein RnfG